MNIIKDDPMSFYTGNLSKLIVQGIKEQGGIIDEEDLASYKTIVRKVVEFDLDSDSKLYTIGAPFSGDLLVFMLKTLQTLNISKSDLINNKIPANVYHKVVEIMKFTFAIRNYYSDPDFSKIDLEKA